jgi:hypothetical protein
MFAGYYNDLQESIANTWWITPEVVVQYQGIAKFKADQACSMDPSTKGSREGMATTTVLC